MKKCPNPMPGEDSHIGIRRIFEAEDIGDRFTPAEREPDERPRQQGKK